MTEQQALQALYSITELSNPNLVFGSRRGPSNDRPFFCRRLVASADLCNRLAGRVLNRLGELRTVAPPAQVRLYDPAYAAAEDEPRFLRIEDDVVIQEVHESITENIANLDPFDPEERGNGRLSYYCLVAEDNQGNQVRFYKGMAPGKQLKPTNKVQAIWMGNKFVSADSTPIVFDPRFIGVSYRGYMFIFGTGGFETLFHYYEELAGHAEEMLNEVHATHVMIDDFDDLKTRLLGNRANVKRLRGIAKRGHLEHYSTATMQATIQEFGLALTVDEGPDGRPHLHWQDGQEPEVLKLLDDYYLKSPTSARRYGANSKELLAAPQPPPSTP